MLTIKKHYFSLFKDKNAKKINIAITCWKRMGEIAYSIAVTKTVRLQNVVTRKSMLMLQYSPIV